MSNLHQCVDCGKTTDDLDGFMSCLECGEKRDVRMLAEEIVGEAFLQFAGHSCHHKHATKESAEKCEREREEKYEAVIGHTSGVIRRIKNEKTLGDAINKNPLSELN